MNATSIRGTLALSFAIATSVSFGACGSPAVKPESDLVRTETALSELAAPDATVVTLLASPTDCLTCYTPVARWVAWGADHPSSFQFVLSRAPNDAERRLLAKLRLLRPSAHVTDVASTVSTPMILVFRDRVAIYRETLSPASRSSPLLDLLGGRSLDAVQEQVGQLGALSAVIAGASRLP